MSESPKEIETKRESLADLRQQLRQAEVDCAYWRGRAEALESAQQPKGGITPEMFANFLKARMEQQKGDGDGVS